METLHCPHQLSFLRQEMSIDIERRSSSHHPPDPKRCALTPKYTLLPSTTIDLKRFIVICNEKNLLACRQLQRFQLLVTMSNA